MGIWRSLNGTVTLHLTVPDLHRLFSEFQKWDIPLTQVQFIDELSVRFTISRQFLKMVIGLTERAGGEWRTVRRNGLYCALFGLGKRPILVAGVALLIFLTVFLPTRILFFQVEGNTAVPTRQIIALAAENGLEFGAIRRDIRSEKLKNALLKSIPELEWVGINTSGCVATISVRERQGIDTPQPQPPVSSIVAVYDGVIQEITVTGGSPRVKPGDPVEAGQILISGYTDCGLSVRAERASGEVYAKTSREISLISPTFSPRTGDLIGESKNFILFFGKNRINLYQSSGILDSSCVKMYVEKYVTLPGGFILPLGIVTEYCYYYKDAPFTEVVSETVLQQSAQHYLTSQMVAGSVLSRDERIDPQEDCLLLEGKYECLEMIGREQSEEIITP